jgi:hypothetical protein
VDVICRFGFALQYRLLNFSSRSCLYRVHGLFDTVNDIVTNVSTQVFKHILVLPSTSRKGGLKLEKFREKRCEIIG